MFLQNDVTFERKFSLDWGDAETDAYIESLLKDVLHEIGRKILHRLISSINRRMHKGFPEMLTYLLNKPMEYCSHMFVHVQYDTLYRVLYAIILARNENARLEEQPLTVPVSRKAKLVFSDYRFRPKSLDCFPFYFFFAACDAVTKLTSESLQWEVLYSVDRQCTKRQDTAKLLYSLTCPRRFLVDSQGQPVHVYDYYVRLRVDKPWYVPLLSGQLPRIPDATSTAKERGTFALRMMVLFRAHRDQESFVEEIFRGTIVSGTEDGVWDFVYKEYLRWKEHDIDAVARRIHAKQMFRVH